MLDAAEALPLDAHNPSDHHGCCGYRVGWIVAITHPQAESHASSNLQRRGYQTYLPLILVTRTDPVTPSLVHRRWVPMFRGYVFCHYDSRDPRRPIRETPGVRDVVRCGAEVQWVPAGAVQAVQAAEAAAAAAATQPPDGRLAPRSASVGAPVALRCGPLHGLPAVITSLDGDHANITLMMLGQLRNLSISLDCLEPRAAG